MSAVVVRDGVPVWEKGFGFQNVATRLRATPDTPYLVGGHDGYARPRCCSCSASSSVASGSTNRSRPTGLTAPDPEATLRQLLSHAPADPAKELFLYSPERYARLTPLMEWCAPQPYRKSVAHRILNRLAMRDSVPGTDLQDPALPLPEGMFDPEDLEHYRQVLARLAVPYKVDGKGRAERNDLPACRSTRPAGWSPPSAISRGSTRRSTHDATRAAAAGNPGGRLEPRGERGGVASPMGSAGSCSLQGRAIVWHFGYVLNGYSSLIVKVPARGLTFILLANGDGLSAPFQLQSGDVTRSLFATLFLRLAV
jgi:CubicO group peptidase (beta-lactamase class C family)